MHVCTQELLMRGMRGFDDRERFDEREMKKSFPSHHGRTWRFLSSIYVCVFSVVVPQCACSLSVPQSRRRRL
jgi:hypothetical protein